MAFYDSDFFVPQSAGSIILSKDSVELNEIVATDTVTVAATGVVSVESSDDTICTASVSGNTITINRVATPTGTPLNATVTVTAAASPDHLTTSETISVEVVAVIYGAEWAGTSTPSWSRTDGASGFTDPVPAFVDTSATPISPSSPFDNIMPWSGMEVVNDNEVGKLVKIPKYWYKWTRTGAKMKLQISNKALPGFLVSPAHAERGDNNGERDFVYVGAYQCSAASGSQYKSVSGVAPIAGGITRAAARTNIHALGTTIWQWDYAMYWTIMMLYLVEYAHWDAQLKIGFGCTSGGSVEYTGQTDNLTYHTGIYANRRTTYGPVKYRHIEGLWSNVNEFCDGVYVNGGKVYGINNPADFSDETGGVEIASSLPSYGVISEWTEPTAQGYEYALIPKSYVNYQNNTTYICDTWGNNYAGSNPGVFILNHGATQDRAYGPFASVVYKSTQNTVFGCRLMKLPVNV